MNKILLIDDEVEAVDMMREYLSARGFTIVSAVDGEDGLKKHESEKPDIIICDIRMPKKDGFQFLQELRATQRWVPVIMATALSDPASVLKGYGLEADYYISKPINLEELFKAIRIISSLIPLREH